MAKNEASVYPSLIGRHMDLSLPLEQRPTGGLGIHLMRSMMDRIHYRRSGGNNLLRLEKSPR